MLTPSRDKIISLKWFIYAWKYVSLYNVTVCWLVYQWAFILCVCNIRKDSLSCYIKFLFFLKFIWHLFMVVQLFEICFPWDLKPLCKESLQVDLVNAFLSLINDQESWIKDHGLTWGHRPRSWHQRPTGERTRRPPCSPSTPPPTDSSPHYT